MLTLLSGHRHEKVLHAYSLMNSSKLYQIHLHVCTHLNSNQTVGKAYLSVLNIIFGFTCISSA